MEQHDSCSNHSSTGLLAGRGAERDEKQSLLELLRAASRKQSLLGGALWPRPCLQSQVAQNDVPLYLHPKVAPKSRKVGQKFYAAGSRCMLWVACTRRVKRASGHDTANGVRRFGLYVANSFQRDLFLTCLRLSPRKRSMVDHV